MLKVLDTAAETEEGTEEPTLDELAREGARRMLMTALAAEVAQYVETHQAAHDEAGRRLVVCNGRGKARKVTCGAGTLEVQAPRVNDKRVDGAGQRERFTSRILPPYMRRSPKVAEVLPILYLRGLSTGDFREALPVLLGDDAAGLSATNIARLTAVWEAEYRQFRQRDRAACDYVYVWVDGIHFNIRLEDDRLCTLVMIGVRPDGTKELVALEDGYRESTDSWAEVLRDLQRRGLQAPVVAVGDGALGFWAAGRDVWADTAEQRDWFHKLGNVLDKLPKRLQPKAKRVLHDILAADTREQAEEHLEGFVTAYEAKYPKVAACLAADRESPAHSCAPGFPWTLDCERVLAGGVSKWGSQIKVRRRRREPGGRPEMLPGTAVGDGFRPGASARRCCVCCAARILSPCRGSWGSRRRGPRSGGISFWPQARPA